MPMLLTKLMAAGLGSGLANAFCADTADSQTATGTNQATAFETSTAFVRFTTVASGTGCLLDNGARGDSQFIINAGANALSVYPHIGGSINGLGTNAAFSIPAGSWAAFDRYTDTLWTASNDAASSSFVQSGTAPTYGWASRTVQGKEGDWISVKDVKCSDGLAVAGDGSHDDTTGLNAAFAWAANNNKSVYLPTGTYKITDTLWVVPEGSTSKSAHIVGAGGGYWESGAQTIIDASTITSKPAMNMQVARGVYLGHFLLVGGSKEIETQISQANLTYSASYVTGGFRDSQYSPYCGICIDGGVGPTPPDGGYSGFTYRSSTSGTETVVLDRLTIRRFVVGIMHNPENGALQGNSVSVIEPIILNTKVAIASGQTQSNCLRVYGGLIEWMRSGYSGTDYGQKAGEGIHFFGTEFDSAFEIFSHSPAQGALYLSGIRAESIHRIGMAGAGSSTVTYPVVMNGCDIHLLSAALGTRCPTVLEAPTGPVIWTGGQLTDDGASGPDAYVLTGLNCILDSVHIHLLNRYRPYVGGVADFAYPTILRNCRITDATSALTLDDPHRSFSTITGRMTAHWSSGFWRKDTGVLYSYLPSTSITSGSNYELVGTMSNIAFTASTLTFNNTDAAGGIMVGDLIMWRLNAVGGSSVQYVVPVAKVTSVAAPTVTCSLLYARSYYDETYAPANTSVLVHDWAPGQALTGDTHSNTTLDNVSPTTILQNGDWITAAAGIPSKTRVVSGGGTATITLSRSATDTASGKTLYFGRIHTFTTTAAF